MDYLPLSVAKSKRDDLYVYLINIVLKDQSSSESNKIFLCPISAFFILSKAYSITSSSTFESSSLSLYFASIFVPSPRISNFKSNEACILELIVDCRTALTVFDAPEDNSGIFSNASPTRMSSDSELGRW